MTCRCYAVVLAALLAAPLLLPAAGRAEGLVLTNGMRAGLNIASVTVKDEEADILPVLGVSLGWWIAWAATDTFALQLETLLAMKGAGIDGDPVQTVSLWYLDVPVLAKWTPAIAETVRPNVYAGPAFGFLLSAKMASEDRIVDFRDQLKGNDLGLVIGAGVDLLQKDGGVATVDVRGQIGLANIAREGPAVTNSLLSALFGFVF